MPIKHSQLRVRREVFQMKRKLRRQVSSFDIKFDFYDIVGGKWIKIRSADGEVVVDFY